MKKSLKKKIIFLEVSASYRVDDLEKYFSINLDFADEDEVETVWRISFFKN